MFVASVLDGFDIKVVSPSVGDFVGFVLRDFMVLISHFSSFFSSSYPTLVVCCSWFLVSLRVPRRGTARTFLFTLSSQFVSSTPIFLALFSIYPSI